MAPVVAAKMAVILKSGMGTGPIPGSVRLMQSLTAFHRINMKRKSVPERIDLASDSGSHSPLEIGPDSLSIITYNEIIN
jgi:hypothetical protein